MTDDPKVTSDGTTPASDGAAAIDISKYIPKEEYDKTTASHKSEVEGLKGALDSAKMSLLDPEYIDFLESKRAAAAPQADGTTDNKAAVEYDALVRELKSTKAQVHDIMAVMELKDVQERFKDFGDYRDDVQKLIETSQAPLTFEQAYKIAKATDPSKSKTPMASAKDFPGNEKPTGSVPAGSLVQKDFKNAEDAGEDAWNSVMGPGKDRL